MCVVPVKGTFFSICNKTENCWVTIRYFVQPDSTSQNLLSLGEKSLYSSGEHNLENTRCVILQWLLILVNISYIIYLILTCYFRELRDGQQGEY
jgi:hypothetical protein